MPVSYGVGKEIFTIEGKSENLEFLREAWLILSIPETDLTDKNTKVKIRKQ
jgi:isoquinoline 1-oxidoreductase alpha subunit